MSNQKTVFVAYASNPSTLGEIIEDGCEKANRFSDTRTYNTWKQNDIVGLDLVQPIIDGIESSDFIVADISTLNNNVVYEIGYAIGCGKRTKVVRYSNAETSQEEINRIGIFDTLGYEGYSSSMELAQVISSELSDRIIPLDFVKFFSTS